MLLHACSTPASRLLHTLIITQLLRTLPNSLDGRGGRMGWSLCWGLVSAVSLPIGAFLGIWRLPSERLRAAMMAFGGGALFFALSVELIGHSVHEVAGDPAKQRRVIGVMAGAALVGGMLFEFLDSLLNAKGAHVTNATAFQRYLDKVRVVLARKKLRQLQQVPLFHAVPPEDLRTLLPFMKRADFEAGEQVRPGMPRVQRRHDRLQRHRKHLIGFYSTTAEPLLIA